MVSSFDGSDDFIRIGDPVKRFGVFVGFGDEEIDGGLEINEGVEDTTVKPPPGEFGEETFDGIELGEETFDGIEPRTGCRGEGENKPLVAIEPGPDLWMLMGGVVVEHDMDGLVFGNLSVDRVQEADELLMPVTLHIAPDHGPMSCRTGECRCRNLCIFPLCF